MMNAFTQGYSDYLYGIPASLNPYSSENVYERAEWYDGWYAANDYYKGIGDSFYDSNS